MAQPDSIVPRNSKSAAISATTIPKHVRGSSPCDLLMNLASHYRSIVHCAVFESLEEICPIVVRSCTPGR